MKYDDSLSAIIRRALLWRGSQDLKAKVQRTTPDNPAGPASFALLDRERLVAALAAYHDRIERLRAELLDVATMADRLFSCVDPNETCSTCSRGIFNACETCDHGFDCQNTTMSCAKCLGCDESDGSK
jgi:hypothetical protein